MEAKILAICDKEKQYAMKLMKAFSEKKNFGFQVRVFSDIEELEQFLSELKVEILLISGGYMSEEISNLHVGKIILLSDGEVFEEFSDYECIYKYQSADHILKEILCYYAEYARPVAGMYAGKKQFEVYGVYSPIGRCGKSALAAALARKYGTRKKTLLLDLQSFSAISEQFDKEELWDLADMIYFLRQGKKTFLYKLGSIVRSKDTFDYILPMKTPADLKSVTLAEWTELLEKLSADSEYDVIVIDFGNDVCGIFQLLNQCTKIYTPVLEDHESNNKIENFGRVLKFEDFEKTIENIQKVTVPEGLGYRNVQAFMNEWVERSVTI